ncbi:hypothetical protein [Thiomicrospira sp. WB1]|uniref:hypothetical protein n=1 Tax=Thiomicrospira sp. WB1 TaxID=1685380 RepID=UPI000748B4C8|nr:hypothetical protein [Thiomicrospira sp. WB1]KUJ71229.1 hypothetical protein AVO41_10250 [Thiomicrospira sp. WB1]
MNFRPLFRKLPTWAWVLIGASVITVLFSAFPPQQDQTPPELLPWNASYNAQGQLEALGLTVGQDTPQQAIDLYGHDFEVKLFSKKDEDNKTAEVFFPSIHISSIHGAIALRLKVPQEQLNHFYSEGVQTTVTKLGNREVTPHNEAIEILKQSPIQSVTLVPRKSLTERAIKMRFGEPERTEVQSDGVPHWFYPDKGLEIILNNEGPDALQYYLF